MLRCIDKLHCNGANWRHSRISPLGKPLALLAQEIWLFIIWHCFKPEDMQNVCS